MFLPHRLVAIGVLVGASLLAFSIPQIRKPVSRLLSFSGPNAGDHADIRLPQINAALAAAKPGFIFLAGDSHAELMGEGTLCGLPVVNGGSHGANAQVYSSLLSELEFKAQPSKSILMIGTNNIFKKHKISDTRNLSRLIETIKEIAIFLKNTGGTIVMTPLPPIRPIVAKALDENALASLSFELKKLCLQDASCQFVDPYEAARTEEFGIAKPEAVSDGLHLSDYGQVRHAFEAAICGPSIPSAAIAADKRQAAPPSPVSSRLATGK